MQDRLQFYIDGQWVDPEGKETRDVINPATEEPIGKIAMGTAADVDKAAAAARKAFASYSQTSREKRLELLSKIIDTYKARYDEIAEMITAEMGSPLGFSKAAQAATGIAHLKSMSKVLADFQFEEIRGTTQLRHEPIGVCGLITPWNWPVNQVMVKVAPALAAGCTMVLKPSEETPLTSAILAEVMHDAGVPAGVFNMVNGDGPTVGAAIAAHPEVDMVSFTGSTRAGVLVAKAAADTVKRVAQELGGKSPNIILPSADLPKAIKGGIINCYSNAGQSCAAPTRMLVPAEMHDEAAELAKAAAEKLVVGDPMDEATRIGPVVNKAQWDKIQELIQSGIDEGATLVTGGTGLPEGLDRGFYIRPTVFANVTNDMRIAREEIFGPVLSILPYKDEDEAIRIANDTLYGLAGYVMGEIGHARKVAARLRTGTVHINGAGPDFGAPFGGYKQSGNGREWGGYGFEEFLEIKSVMGFEEAA